MLSSIEPRPPGEKRRKEKEKKGEEEEECVELKWRILVYISSATTQWKTPSVSMGTGTTPCISSCRRQEAPVCLYKKKGRWRFSMSCVSFLHRNHMHLTLSLAHRTKLKEMLTVCRTAVQACSQSCFLSFTFEPGGAIRPRNA